MSLNKMNLNGRAYKFGDNISTDLIISGRYKFSIQDLEELSKHLMEDLFPGFYNRLIPNGAFIVAGRNFGCGSSREQAPLVIKKAGIRVLIAKSFARIFYRNSINIGLVLVECNTDQIDDGDGLSLDLEKGKLKNIKKGIDIEIKSLSTIVKELLKDGGLIEHFKKHGGLKFETT